MLLSFCALFLATPAAGSQDSLPAAAVAPDSVAEVAVLPARPAQGSLIQVVLRPSGEAPTAITSDVAGEPLHFEARPAGVFRALAAVPIDAPDTLRLSLVLLRPSRVDTVPVVIPVQRGAYPMERLRVAPKFGAPPDSALAARIRAEGELARGVSRRAHETPRMWSGSWVRPRPSRITSGFGRGREFNGVVQSRHMGTDFAGATGAPVRAANRGIVRLVADFYLAGKAVYVDHGEGLVTGYFHLSEATVAEGDTVSRGQRIGLVGASGRVTGPHLHWIARYGTVSVNPMGLLKIDEDETVVER
jgi:murein DD-endopeptidase MepM/ murein hydrolase activator NlpD